MNTYKDTINVLTHEIFEANKAQGFWKDNAYECLHNDAGYFALKIALIHSELSEMLEAYRHDVYSMSSKIEASAIAEELADVVIRAFDLGGAMQLSLGDVIEKKLHYNAQRIYKHGKNF